MKAAAIGIGSNSVRCLLAEEAEGTFRRLWRDREGTRLFAGLDGQGNLSPESMEKTAGAVKRMAEEARIRGAEKLYLFATSAARDARNGADFVEALRRAAGEEPRILSGEEEAGYSFLGASAAAGGERCGVIDIGGGSTEIAVGSRDGLECSFSCQMGAVRLYRRLRIESAEDMPPVEAAAAEMLRERLAEEKALALPEIWVGTGGTFTALAAMIRRCPWTDRTDTQGTRLNLAQIRAAGEELAPLTPEQRLLIPSLQPSRADIVVHGICILLGVLRALERDSVIVSEWGNLDGYLAEQMRMHHSSITMGKE